MDCVIAHGAVVTAGGAFRADIGIHAGRIVALGESLASAATKTIDATGCFVLPGGIDMHTHLDTPAFGHVTADDFQTGTIAAACGGTTTIVDFAQQPRGATLAETLDLWHGKARGKASIDYGFHVIVTDLNPTTCRELESLPDQGVTSFKVFMAYKGKVGLDDAAMIRVLDIARRAGARVMVHAENGDAIDFLRARCLAAGETAPRFHAETRPPAVEAEATARAIMLAQIAGAPLYIVHMSCREALEEMVRARLRGIEVSGETCAQYLYTVKEDLDRLDFGGARYVFTPPPRGLADQAALWSALADGTLQTLSSDHCAWNFRGHKDAGRDDFTRIPNGAPGIEERMTMLYQGVHEGRLSLARFVDLTATTPARLFGLYPRKGAIAIGADADLVVWDPAVKRTITQANLHHGVDYTLYEGREVFGAPRTVLLRGGVIVEGERFVGEAGAGRFLRRDKVPPRLEARP